MRKPSANPRSCGSSRLGLWWGRAKFRVALRCFDLWVWACGVARASVDLASEVATVRCDPCGWAHEPVSFMATFSEFRPGRRRPRRRPRPCHAVFLGASARVASHYWRRTQVWNRAELESLVGRHRGAETATEIAGVAWSDHERTLRPFRFRIDWATGTWRTMEEFGSGAGRARPLPTLFSLDEFVGEVVSPPPAALGGGAKPPAGSTGE